MITQKLALIYNRHTFLDLPMFWQLFKRYWFISLCIPIVVAGFCFKAYVEQDFIYEKEVRFKVLEAKESVNSVMTPMSSTAEGDELDKLKPVHKILTSWKFKQEIANELISFAEFSQLKFKTEKEGVLTGNDLRVNCEDVANCLIDKVSDSLQSHIKVKDNKLTGDASIFFFTYNQSLLAELENIVVSKLQAYRVSELKSELADELKEFRIIVGNKEVELQNSIDRETVGQEKVLDKKAQDVTDQIKDLQEILNERKSELYQARRRLNLIESEYKTSITSKSRVEYEKKEKLEAEIKDIRNNIQALTLAPINRGSTNWFVLQELRQTLRKRQNDLAELGSVDKLTEAKDKFEKVKNEEIPDAKIQVNVLKDNVRKVEKEIAKLKTQRDKILEEKNNLGAGVSKYQGKVAELQRLRVQLSSLEMEMAQVKSDLKFEEFNPFLETQFTHSKGKLIVIWFALSLFFAMVYCMIRFFFDDRIYSEREIKALYPNLQVIKANVEFERAA